MTCVIHVIFFSLYNFTVSLLTPDAGTWTYTFQAVVCMCTFTTVWSHDWQLIFNESHDWEVTWQEVMICSIELDCCLSCVHAYGFVYTCCSVYMHAAASAWRQTTVMLQAPSRSVQDAADLVIAKKFRLFKKPFFSIWFFRAHFYLKQTADLHIQTYWPANLSQVNKVRWCSSNQVH